jgi:hypothetical protein
MLSSAGDNGALPAIEEKGTTGNGAFAESNTLWREPTLGLSVKSSSPRVKKILSENKLSAKKFFAESKKKTLGEEILHREYFYCSRRSNFKKFTFSPSKFFILNMHLYKEYVQI